MKLNLKNPIVFFDLETTGINVAKDRIVEMAFLIVHPNGNEESKLFRVNPGMPIPKESTEIHGITDEDVKDEPMFKDLAQNLAKTFEGCDFAGFNSNKFDIPLLAEEFLRSDIDFDFKKRKCVDVQVIFHKMEQRTLGAAYKFYCKKELIDAHTAMADTKATYEILKSQLDVYDNLENEVSSLAEFSSHTKNADFLGRIVYDADGDEIFNFGKYKGKKVEDVLSKDPGYYGWMMNGDFPLYTKNVLTKIKLRSFIK